MQRPAFSNAKTSLSIHLVDSPPNVRLRLLHGVQLAILRHGPRVITILANQLLQPLPLLLALVSLLLGRGVAGLLDQRLDHLGLPPVLLDTAPFLVLLHLPVTHLRVRVELVQRVVERVGRPADHADNLAVGVPLHPRHVQRLARRPGAVDGEGVGGAEGLLDAQRLLGAARGAL